MEQAQTNYEQLLLPGLVSEKFLPWLSGSIPPAWRRFYKSELWKKVVNRIDSSQLMDICVINRTSEKSTMTFCNLWRVTKHANDPRIVLHEFSLRTNKWEEKNTAAITWVDLLPLLRLHQEPLQVDALLRLIPATLDLQRYYRVNEALLSLGEAGFQRTIWPYINFCRLDDDICRRLTLLLLRKVICEDNAIYSAYISLPERRLRAHELWACCWRFARFVSGFNWRDVRRVLWEDFLDKKVMSALCAKNNNGLAITLAAYLEVSPYAQDLLRIARESRNLLPLLNYIPPQNWRRRDLFKNEELRKAGADFSGLGDTHLRCLRKYPSSVLCEWDYHNDNRLRDVLDLLLGVQIQEKTPACILRHVVKHFRGRCGLFQEFADELGTMEQVQRIYRLYIRYCLNLWKQKGYKLLFRYMRHDPDLSQIVAWFLDEGGERGQPDKNATWNSIRRAVRAWHEAHQDMEWLPVEEGWQEFEKLHWESLIGETEIVGVSVRPLTSGADLQAEGNKMRHCVASFASRCHQLNFRIFSLTEKNGACSTLCISPDPAGGFMVYEHKGVQNSEVSMAADDTANEICRLYEEAEARKNREAG